MSETLIVNEIFLSLQGESTFAGLPCVFVRLTGCNLRCSYCDTAYAFTEGRKMPVEQAQAEVLRLVAGFARTARNDNGDMRLPIVELTGGEPLLQPNSLRLMTWLCDQNFTVLIETSGAHDISGIDDRVHRIMDLKCPSSGEAGRNLWANIPHLRPRDEVKFVIATCQDYEWAKSKLAEYNLAAICPLLFSWAEPLLPGQQHPTLKPIPADHTPISRRELAERIVSEGLPVRFQVQLHKVIWEKDARGV